MGIVESRPRHSDASSGVERGQECQSSGSPEECYGLGCSSSQSNDAGENRMLVHVSYETWGINRGRT